MIYTSYIALRPHIPFPCFTIVAYPPKERGCENIPLLAPPKELLWRAKDGRMSFEEYAQEFAGVLREREPEIREVLHSILVRHPDIVLLCFERDHTRCHRSIVCTVLEEWGFQCGGELDALSLRKIRRCNHASV